MSQRQQLPFASSHLPNFYKKRTAGWALGAHWPWKAVSWMAPGEKGHSAEFTGDLLCWARLRHPTDLLPCMFTGGFSSQEQIIPVHFFNLLVVTGLSREVRTGNKTWNLSHTYLKQESYYCTKNHPIDVKPPKGRSEPSASWPCLDGLNRCSQQSWAPVLSNPPSLFSWLSPF